MTQIPKTERFRAYVDKIVRSSKPGTKLVSSKLAISLCHEVYHGPSTNDIGTALRERTDVKKIGDGVWEVL